jgi:hypothetical protein
VAETAEAVAETAEAAVATAPLSGEAVKATVALENGEVVAKVDCCSEEWVALVGHNLEARCTPLAIQQPPPFGFSYFSQVPIFPCRVVQLRLLKILLDIIHHDDSVPFWNRSAMPSCVRHNWYGHADRRRHS